MPLLLYVGPVQPEIDPSMRRQTAGPVRRQRSRSEGGTALYSAVLAQTRQEAHRCRLTARLVLNLLRLLPVDQDNRNIVDIGSCWTRHNQPVYRLQGVVGIIFRQNLMDRKPSIH